MREVLADGRWVADGNYQTVRDIVWGRAETVVWLDYPLSLVLWRRTLRSVQRWISQEELWNGNRERLSTLLSSRDSLFLWALRSHRQRRRELPLLFASPEYAHLRVVRLRSPSEMRDWLTGLS